jgi:hypothetical protein
VKTKGLRIATRYTSIDELVAKLCHYCDGDSLFVGTRDAQAVGIEAPFALQLADQTYALRGWCEVLEVWATPDNPYHKPGLRLRLSQLTPESQAVLAQLQAAGGGAAVDVAAAVAAPGQGEGEGPGGGQGEQAHAGPEPERGPEQGSEQASEQAAGAGDGARRPRRVTLQPAQGQLRKPAPIPLAALAARGRIESIRRAGEHPPAPRLARGSGPEPGDNPLDNPLLDLSIVSLEDLVENRLAESASANTDEGGVDGTDEAADDGQTLAQPWRVLTPPKRAPTWATPPAVAKTPAPVLLPAPPATPSAQMPVEPGAISAEMAAQRPAEPPTEVLPEVPAAASDPATEIAADPPTEVSARGGTVLAPPAAVLPGRRPATPAPVPAGAANTPLPRAVTPRPPTPAPGFAPTSARAATPLPVPGAHTSARPATPLPYGPVLPLLTSPRSEPPPPRSAALRWGLAIAAALLLIGGAVAAALAI